MELHIDFTTNSLFEACVGQTSVDFSAVRVTAPEGADSVYKDYVLSKDMYPEWRDALNIEVERFNLRHSSLVKSSENAPDRLCWTFSSDSGIAHPQTLGSMVFACLQYRMLAWWYNGRSQNNQLLYSMRAEELNTAIYNLSGSAMMDRRLRYF